jgi:alpha/beta hydrolase fold
MKTTSEPRNLRSTANLGVKVPRICLGEAVRQELLAVNPAVRVKLLKSTAESKPRAFTLDEIKRILRACPDDTEWRGLVLFGPYLGQRIGELAKLPFQLARWIRCLQVSRMALMVFVMLASFQLPAQAQGKERPMGHPTYYRTTQIDGLSIFYREAGPKDAPTLLLLHGLPSSSRMFEPLFARLSDSYHLVAPDYPGFGHSDWPDPKKFAYTFDHFAEIVNHFTEAFGLSHYTLYMQDYGGPGVGAEIHDYGQVFRKDLNRK